MMFSARLILSLAMFAKSHVLSENSKVPELTAEKFEEYLTGQKFVYNTWYAPWCVWSQKILPVLDEAAEVLAGYLLVMY